MYRSRVLYRELYSQVLRPSQATDPAFHILIVQLQDHTEIKHCGLRLITQHVHTPARAFEMQLWTSSILVMATAKIIHSAHAAHRQLRKLSVVHMHGFKETTDS